MRFLSRTFATAAATALAVAALATVPALAGTGMPSPWQMNLQGAVTPVAEFIHWFHDWLNIIITIVTLFVLALLVYVVFRFNEKANPVPSKTTHNALLEVAWTVIPVLILVVIAIPSFRLLKLQLEVPQSDMTLKVTGNQWRWTYEYPKESGGFTFDSLMLNEEERAKAIASKRITEAEAPRLLAVDNEAVIPVGKTVRVQVTASDVIHKFTVPSFGIKIDAIPGRLNETWFKAEREGIYYGQCSFICGQDHAYMPIAVRVVSQERYAAWLAEAKQKFANAEDAGSKFAAASK
ncbi:cytochrome c oxidase subunit II [Bosea sp. 47.2.35]|jgi:cytochrome c oxidase subunit 2|uniref:cytochrome c oxidase subunit II n=1 Tax=Bosea TaxID=85413 RepID=UPI00286246C4|nr:cytochrome c oxidase subunit 2 [Bosea robiniae]MDR6893447.1 cytochrome c oxidase subunit 2 [Bosea sp. BE109]MDR7136854.1 cytochrome c oxidase subunit 2 [Bosea sp. BE168]MDR7173553.1 cytochrome c oxidase subunit 2 [Bosea sp. BE271]